MHDVTQILKSVLQGDKAAAERLLPLVYDELRKLAAARMASERPDHTLTSTALVHEAYVRLVDGEQAANWDGRGHFFAAAAEAMRRILVDHAREKGAAKRGGDRRRLDVDSVDLAVTASPADMLALNDALDALARIDSTAAQLVQLRYFAGLNVDQAAPALNISTATAYRHWNYARAWLHSELLGSNETNDEEGEH